MLHGSVVKNLPVPQKPQGMHAPPLGQDDPLEEGMATHSSVLAWRTTWTGGPGGLQSTGLVVSGVSSVVTTRRPQS